MARYDKHLHKAVSEQMTLTDVQKSDIWSNGVIK